MKKLFLASCLVLTMSLTACAVGPQRGIFDTDKTQLQLRSIQSRTFETIDRERTLRNVIATLQDLGFVIEKADNGLGAVTASKFVGTQELRMTVTVRANGQKRMLVRANAQYGLSPIEDAETYQDFFHSMEKSMYLAAEGVS